MTCAMKPDVSPETDGIFGQSIERAIRDRDSLTYEHVHADDAPQRLVTSCKRFDITVTPNFAGTCSRTSAPERSVDSGAHRALVLYPRHVLRTSPQHGS